MHRENSSNNTDAPRERQHYRPEESEAGLLTLTAKLKLIYFSEILMIYGLDSIEAEGNK